MMQRYSRTLRSSFGTRSLFRAPGRSVSAPRRYASSGTSEEYYKGIDPWVVGLPLLSFGLLAFYKTTAPTDYHSQEYKNRMAYIATRQEYYTALAKEILKSFEVQEYTDPEDGVTVNVNEPSLPEEDIRVASFLPTPFEEFNPGSKITSRNAPVEVSDELLSYLEESLKKDGLNDVLEIIKRGTA
ncbi:hypothetical protein V1525DRAFT_397518 [Lipomyces kononenkoae]|uniref:Uncharacterized protein n=1 Tax=Lipomyces kononenkoae TaxID=34357 RepID=A0ACC3T715_LIPKO